MPSIIPPKTINADSNPDNLILVNRSIKPKFKPPLPFLYLQIALNLHKSLFFVR
jgi:hypothetical protein